MFQKFRTKAKKGEATFKILLESHQIHIKTKILKLIEVVK